MGKFGGKMKLGKLRTRKGLGEKLPRPAKESLDHAEKGLSGRLRDAETGLGKRLTIGPDSPLNKLPS